MSEPPSSNQVEVKEGDILDDKYRVEKVLGAGGMGVVVAATHIVLNNRVALKFLLPSVAKHEQTAARFLREAQAAVRIKSPHVARVLDVGTMQDSGSPYMVMEHLEGKDLSEVLEIQGSLEVDLACMYTLQACEALAAAHSAGIVHRDIKPANLFLTVAGDGSAVVKVLDFGISKNTVDMGISNLTQTQVSMGSPLYMSPEQMRSARDVDERTDVWSLGVVLFEMLTGQMPFMADTMPQLCALVLEEDAPRVSIARPGLPQGLDDAIARCLKKDREDRFLDVGALAQAIAPFVPEWGQASAERTTRILAGAGLSRTVGHIEAPRPTYSSVSELAEAPLRGTETAFGRTGPETPTEPPTRVPYMLWATAAAAVLLVGGGVWAIAGEDGAPAASQPPPPLPASAPPERSGVRLVPSPPIIAEPVPEPEPEPAATATSAAPAEATSPAAKPAKRPWRAKPRKKARPKKPDRSKVFDDRF